MRLETYSKSEEINCSSIFGFHLPPGCISCEKTLLGVSPSDSTLARLRPAMLKVDDVVVVVSVCGSSE